MNMFSIHSRNYIAAGAAILCLSSLLAACSPEHTATHEAPLPSYHTEESTETSVAETLPLVETGAILTTPEETADMSSVMKEASISILSHDGTIGEFDFFTCNETQLFGDFTISLADYAGEEYLMLSHNGIVLLAKEDGSDAMLFYNDQRLDLPFPCYFNLDYEFLALHQGDFLGNGGHQLAMVIPMETGSGVDVEHLYLIDLDTMSMVPTHTQDQTYEQDMQALFDAHFAEIQMTDDYDLFQYVQYHIQEGLIFVEYGACDEDNIYICFLDAALTYDGAKMVLDPAMTFHDELY